MRPYITLFAALEAKKVRFAVAGGLAAVLHGVPRMTFDLDLVIELESNNLRLLVDVLSEEGYVPRLPVSVVALLDAEMRADWVENRNLVAFTLYHRLRPMEEVDLLLAVQFSWSEIELSIQRLPLGDITVPVVGRELLREMKLATGREKDLLDAKLLGERKL